MDTGHQTRLREASRPLACYTPSCDACKFNLCTQVNFLVELYNNFSISYFRFDNCPEEATEARIQLGAWV